MVEMVHDRIAAGETTVVSTAAVLRCGKQMENYHITTFLDSLSPKTLSLEEAMDVSRDRNEMNE
jgi:SUMO ligase MMS21 Smc5/6 complex component